MYYYEFKQDHQRRNPQNMHNFSWKRRHFVLFCWYPHIENLPSSAAQMEHHSGKMNWNEWNFWFHNPQRLRVRILRHLWISQVFNSPSIAYRNLSASKHKRIKESCVLFWNIRLFRPPGDFTLGDLPLTKGTGCSLKSLSMCLLPILSPTLASTS